MIRFKNFWQISLIILLSSLIFGFRAKTITLAQTTPVHINSCQTLSQVNTTYILDNDVSSPGTCFTVTASNITLDLNGKTVTYNTNPGDNVYGYLAQWNKSYLRVTNGSFIQGAGKGYQSIAVYFREINYVKADHLYISYSGDDNQGIVHNGGSWTYDVQIHDNIIRPKGSKRVLTHYGGFAAINVGATYGDIDIYNNDIQGTGYSGINFRYVKPLSDTIRIINNTVKMDTPVRDGYAISISSANNDDIDFEIANNTIIQTSGRGILINGDISDNSPGPGKGTIHDNYIEVRESRDAGEYNAPGASTGITLRFGAHDIKVYNNIVKAYAGQNACPSSFPTSLGADCIARALKIHSGTGGKNIEVYNNAVEVSTTDANLPAAGIYAINTAAVSDINVVFHHNIITSNSIIVDLNGADGSGNYQVFRSNNFIKGANPLGFHSVRAGYWTGKAIENVFLDNIWQNGADRDDLQLSSSGGADYSLWSKWYLDVLVKNSSGQAVSGATVNAAATADGIENLSATTDANGRARLELTEYYRYGTTYPATSNYTRYTPHNLTVSAAGYSPKNLQTTMDTSKEMAIVLGGTDGPIIANVAANVDQLAKTATITWNTNQSVASSVDYGTSTSYGSSQSGGTGTGHSATLTNLTSPATYHFRITAGTNQGVDHTFFLLTKSAQDLTLLKSALINGQPANQARSGDIITYTINYTNGDQQSNSVKIEDPIPVGTSYITGSASNEGSLIGNIVTWNIGNLSSGQSDSVSFQVQVQ